MCDLHAVSRLTLVVKEGNAAAEASCRCVERWLAGRNVPFCTVSHPQETLREHILTGTDLLLVFGGDGTIVAVTRKTLGLGIPIAGVNFGRVGFLAELSEKMWEQALRQAFAKGVRVDLRMSLAFTLLRGNRLLHEGEVVNDATITRGKVARLATLHLDVNGASLSTLRSDGLIFSTPTGSSGYAASAGGPLLMPGINACVVAAICPYLSNFPPLVLTAETVFSATVGEAAPDLYLSIDGQEIYPLAEGDRLEVRGLPGRIQMADFGLAGYFVRLRNAGFVQEARQRN